MITIPFPYGDPLAAFEVFASDPHAVLLHGNGMGENGRYTYLAAAPFRVIHATHKGVTIDGEAVAGDPFSVLERELQRYREDKAKIRLPFSGGAIGFFGNELGGVLERMPVPRRDGLELPLLSVGLYDTIVLFDHEQRE
ncbi:MAG: aminodeoxychorismate/anthranilate synthase component I, partial [Bdellovibrionales bacterium]